MCQSKSLKCIVQMSLHIGNSDLNHHRNMYKTPIVDKNPVPTPIATRTIHKVTTWTMHIIVSIFATQHLFLTKVKYSYGNRVKQISLNFYENGELIVQAIPMCRWFGIQRCDHSFFTWSCYDGCTILFSIH